MNYLKSKKGILIEGTSIIIVFLLSTALVYLLWDNTEIDEELKVGQMLMDVYSVEEKSIKFRLLANIIIHHFIIISSDNHRILWQ